MNQKLAAILMLSTTALLANGEVITGNGYPQDFLDFQKDPSGGFVEDLGLYFQGQIFFASSWLTDFYLTGATNSPDRNLQFLESSNTTGLLTQSFFTEGQSLMDDGGSNPPSDSILLARQNSNNKKDPWDYAGAVGENIFIGFVVETDDGSSVQTNYGFLQLLHESELNYRVVGWAYETVAGADLVTFSVPNPSGLALLATGGMIASRRRRV